MVWSVTLFKCNWYIICKLTFWVASDLNKIPHAGNWDYSFWYTIPLGKFMFSTQMSWLEVAHIQTAMSSRRSWSFGDPKRWNLNSCINQSDNMSGWLSCRNTSEDHSRPHQKWPVKVFILRFSYGLPLKIHRIRLFRVDAQSHAWID